MLLNHQAIAFLSPQSTCQISIPDKGTEALWRCTDSLWTTQDLNSGFASSMLCASVMTSDLMQQKEGCHFEKPRGSIITWMKLYFSQLCWRLWYSSVEQQSFFLQSKEKNYYLLVEENCQEGAQEGLAGYFQIASEPVSHGKYYTHGQL